MLYPSPYYAVIFSSTLAPGSEDYEEMADRLVAAVAQQPGFLGFEAARGPDGKGLTVSYWSSLESIRRWKGDRLHQEAQKLGKGGWYAHYRIRVAQVIEEHGGPGESG